MIIGFIILLSLLGVYLCIKIYTEKDQGAQMVCPLDADCNTVLHSNFSNFFGIRLEVFGFLYYILIALSYALLFAFPFLQNPIYYFILFGLSLAAFLFSLYLIWIQFLILKSWCSWCLMSATLTMLILIFTIIGVSLENISFIPILEYLQQPLVIMHLLGFALGVGGATIADILFFRFLKDSKISEKESSVLSVMSQTIWLGLLILVLSGIGLYIPNTEVLNESVRFLVKTTIVGIIVLNGAFLNLYVAPHLLKISFKDSLTKTCSINNLRKFAFVSGAISFVSWYTAFILGIIGEVKLSFAELFGIYLIILVIAIVFGLLVEKIYCSHAHTNTLDKKTITKHNIDNE